MQQFKKKAFISLLIMAVLYVLYQSWISGHLFRGKEIEVNMEESVTKEQRLKEEAIRGIMESDEFHERALQEAEIIYYQQQMEEARKRLQELDGAGFSSNKRKEEVLSAYLKSKGAEELAYYSSEIIKLDRWIDVVAIVAHETSFCKTGVGGSKNNCGGIKNAKTGDFKSYETPYDSLWDIAYLLNEPHFKGKTIAQMNGTYCVDESHHNNKCPNWTESIEKTADELTILAYSYLQ